MKIFLLGLASASLILLGLAGCQSPVASSSKAAVSGTNLPGLNAESWLTVDSNLHLTTQVVYDYGSSKETYNTDGTFEYLYYHNVNGAKSVSNGERGTYTWDPSACLLQSNTTSTTNDGINWTPNPVGATSLWTNNYGFTTHGGYPCYVKSGSNWVHSNGSLYSATVSGNTVSSGNGQTNSYSFSNGTFGYIKTLTGYSNNSPYTSSVETQSGIYTSYPAGTALTAGNVLSFQVSVTTDVIDTYSSPSSAAVVNNGSPNVYTETVADIGDRFLIFTDASADRSAGTASGQPNRPAH